jgi:hypothetical protein
VCVRCSGDPTTCVGVRSCPQIDYWDQTLLQSDCQKYNPIVDLWYVAHMHACLCETALPLAAHEGLCARWGNVQVCACREGLQVRLLPRVCVPVCACVCLCVPVCACV